MIDFTKTEKHRQIGIFLSPLDDRSFIKHLTKYIFLLALKLHKRCIRKITVSLLLLSRMGMDKKDGKIAGNCQLKAG